MTLSPASKSIVDTRVARFTKLPLSGSTHDKPVKLKPAGFLKNMTADLGTRIIS